jgi:hypothetical protein
MDSDFVYPEKHKKLYTWYRVSENGLSLGSMYNVQLSALQRTATKHFTKGRKLVYKISQFQQLCAFIS